MCTHEEESCADDLQSIDKSVRTSEASVHCNPLASVCVRLMDILISQ